MNSYETKEHIRQQVNDQFEQDQEKLKKQNHIRGYDDRDDIRTNLLESYERLMAFTAKHLPNKFQLINGQRMNVRDHLFREIIGNLLVHREYTNGFPAKFVIENQRRNITREHGHHFR